MTCFMMDNYARHAASMGEEAALALALAQIDEMFPGEIPSSHHYIQGEMHDWSSVPYIHIGYSHCIVGEDSSLFRELAKPLPNGRVMFAGEAYVSEGPNTTVHAALDAGFRAAGEAASFLGISQGAFRHTTKARL
jgi:monoamine oxidase